MKKRSYCTFIISNSGLCQKGTYIKHTYIPLYKNMQSQVWYFNLDLLTAESFISINHCFCLVMRYLYNPLILLACLKYLTSVGRDNRKHQDGQLSCLHIHNTITATWTEVWGFVAKFNICFKFVPDKDSSTRRMLTECAHFVPRAAVSWSSSPSLFTASPVSNISLLSVPKQDHGKDEWKSYSFYAANKEGLELQLTLKTKTIIKNQRQFQCYYFNKS